VRLLLDTHILLALVADPATRKGANKEPLTEPNHELFASVVSIWEIAIKYRLGKLKLGVVPAALPGIFQGIGHTLLIIDHRHVVAELDDEPQTRDPFDRLLLAQCQVEGLRLVTEDRALAGHPLAWRKR